MSKGQHGNREAKKPKKAHAPLAPAGSLPPVPATAVPERTKKK